VPGPEHADYGWAAAAGATAHVFVDALADQCVVDGDDGHHLQRVRRVQAGEILTAADGTGAWRTYEVTTVSPGRLHLEARRALTVEPDVQPHVCVAVALTKGRALDDVVAGVTELGVHRIEPVRSARAVVRWDDERAAGAVARLRVIAREAAMQSRRARIPEVRAVQDLSALVGRGGVVVADRGGIAPAALPAPPDGEWIALVGPEGGFAPEELAMFDAPRANIGHFVLRAQTAPLAVIAVLVQYTTPVPHVVN
jgi:16S rRNA (uracil1498-N3)-methyltransferase